MLVNPWRWLPSRRVFRAAEKHCNLQVSCIEDREAGRGKRLLGVDSEGLRPVGPPFPQSIAIENRTQPAAIKPMSRVARGSP